jgi:hypothetical protein
MMRRRLTNTDPTTSDASAMTSQLADVPDPVAGSTGAGAVVDTGTVVVTGVSSIDDITNASVPLVTFKK